MPLPPDHYMARATEVETLAAQATDAAIRQGYLDLAAKYREMAERAADIRKQLANLDLLAENMTRRQRGKP